jgi:hypothetical protein
MTPTDSLMEETGPLGNKYCYRLYVSPKLTTITTSA